MATFIPTCFYFFPIATFFKGANLSKFLTVHQSKFLHSNFSHSKKIKRLGLEAFLCGLVCNGLQNGGEWHQWRVAKILAKARTVMLQ
jgi:hypothetical protein